MPLEPGTLEPCAHEFIALTESLSAGQLDVSVTTAAAGMSIAVSLKRIADALSYSDTESNLYDILNDIRHNTCCEVPMTPTNNPAAAFVLKASDHELLDKLSPAHKTLLLRRHGDGLSYDTIARETGLPLGTIKSGLHRARAVLLSLRTKQEAQCPSSS